ncbi:hypothetical protein E4U31_005796 [Claviceps sp. LM219 group G6]|nr:hypothetical protein E4U31_005796 [Claviceps sp. LM219 group G6]
MFGCPFDLQDITTPPNAYRLADLETREKQDVMNRSCAPNPGVDHDEEHRDASSEDILWRQLKVKYEIDSLASRDDLSVEQKVKALQEKKHRLRESTPTATNAERANAFADQTSVLASL